MLLCIDRLRRKKEVSIEWYVRYPSIHDVYKSDVCVL